MAIVGHPVAKPDRDALHSMLKRFQDTVFHTADHAIATGLESARREGVR
jgi:hypothetical protein